MVPRPAPLAGSVGKRCDEWTVDKEIRQQKRLVHRRPPDECLQGVATVNDDVQPTVFEGAQEGNKSERLGHRLAAQDRDAIARLANRIEQFLDDLVYVQGHAT